MRRDSVDLSAIAHSVVSRLLEEQSHRKIDLRIQPGLTAFGDIRLLEIALTNLLANAVKFTGRTPAPRIEFHRPGSGHDAPFCVSDNGVGFDMAYSQNLIGAFQRLHKSSDFPGTGIGLAIVQRVIQRHGGRVWADAQPGQGANFCFTVGHD